MQLQRLRERAFVWADVDDNDWNDVRDDCWSSSIEVSSNTSSGNGDGASNSSGTRKKLSNLRLSREALLEKQKRKAMETAVSVPLAQWGSIEEQQLVDGAEWENTSGSGETSSSSVMSRLDDNAESSQRVNVASAGSVHHDEGSCIPCIFVNTKSGCHNGTGCEFCHLFHKKRSRPYKDKRERAQSSESCLLGRLPVKGNSKKLQALPRVSMTSRSSYFSGKPS